jgi:hypothetical protein
MSDRYFGKVVSVQDSLTVVINAGSEKGVGLGDKFLIVGLGETIKDPETNEELEQLEIVKGRGEISHVQSKIATLRSSEIEQTPGTREIKKVSNSGTGFSYSIFVNQTTSTEEIIKPGPERFKQFKDVQIGDRIISLSGHISL